MSIPPAGPFDVVVVGSANLDLVASTHRLPSAGETVVAHSYVEACGGKGLNQAIAAARAGARTAFVGAVGDDTAGSTLRDALIAEGVDVSHLAVVPGPTGRAFIGVDDTAENQIIVVPGANRLLGTAQVDAAAAMLASAKVVVAQLEIPMLAVARAAALAGADTIVVVDPAPATALPDGLVQRVDVLVPNEHEESVIGGASSLVARGARVVVVTEGERGARVVTAGGVDRVAPHRVTPLDSTGAGDAFCGVLCARLAVGGGWPALPDALRAAAVAGALATQVRGASGGPAYNG